jgi:hypothetical protein
MTKEPRSEKIQASCTKTEYSQIMQMASDNNMSIAEFIRARVLYDHAQKYNLFESRVMKILSASAAWLEFKVTKLTDEEFEEFHSLLEIIEQKNDVRHLNNSDVKY